MTYGRPMAGIVRAGGPADYGAAVAVWQAANTARRGGEPGPSQHEFRVHGYGRGQRLYDGRGFRRSGREKDDDVGERIVHYKRAL
jgi:hypothetical protein